MVRGGRWGERISAKCPKGGHIHCALKKDDIASFFADLHFDFQ